MPLSTLVKHFILFTHCLHKDTENMHIHTREGGTAHSLLLERIILIPEICAQCLCEQAHRRCCALMTIKIVKNRVQLCKCVRCMLQTWCLL